MSDDLAVIRATFANWRPVPSRKVLQLVFETPIEQQGEVLNRLGPPDALGSVWCAVAKLSEEAAPSQVPQARSSSSPSNRNEEPPADAGLKRKWHELSYAEQAGIRVNDPEFRRYLEESLPTVLAELGGDHVELVRHICGVKSRSEIQPGTVAAERWVKLDADFRGFSQ